MLGNKDVYFNAVAFWYGVVLAVPFPVEVFCGGIEYRFGLVFFLFS